MLAASCDIFSVPRGSGLATARPWSRLIAVTLSVVCRVKFRDIFRYFGRQSRSMAWADLRLTLVTFSAEPTSEPFEAHLIAGAGGATCQAVATSSAKAEVLGGPCIRFLPI